MPRALLGFLVVSCCAAAPAWADPDASAALARLLELDGTWKATDPDGRFVTCRAVAKNTALVETATGADRTSVLTAITYAREGNTLVATHFGAQGTSRLKLVVSDAKRLRFEATSKDAPVTVLLLVMEGSMLREEVIERGTTTLITLTREYLETLR